MALFERRESDRTEGFISSSSDVATRALSVTVVENDFVEHVYAKVASVYDWTYGPTLHPGRLQAIQRMALRKSEHILEVGVGTGINAVLYPRECTVTGVDFSAEMLEKARDRMARKGVSNVRLLEMDAADLKFADDSFDVVYAPYVMSVVPDPVRVAVEMHRVCRPGGRIIFLNHFRSPNIVLGALERLISPFTIHIGFKADLDLPAFLAQAGLNPVSIEKVNVPRIWSLVTCVKG
jgi:phosphatidylethanolamine/phosphatidyl-N-methylethanolamine N-methyltransferase